ncbi:MAG: right-handed parallel beta-helix repeat-containing protein [Pirellulales bacterium]|nr:right-handed parallel beta-helix repeat-containing protein [Pirellulales bacterium]
MRKATCLIGIIATVPALCSFSAAPVQAAGAKHLYYVAPHGNDAWSGKLPEPNGPKSDGPFATLQRARDEVRTLKGAAGLADPVTVFLRGGTYRITDTIRFTPEDSGAERSPITYAAYPGEKPVVSGGRPIAGWKKADGSLWAATVPGVKEGDWYFHQLFVDGRRCTRARMPNQGYLYTADILAPFDRTKWYQADLAAKTGFLFRNGDIRRWDNFSDALVVIYHSWTTSTHFITELDPQRRIVKLAPRSAWPIGYWWEYNTRYHVENILESLDEPGEWYLDRGTGVVRYWPMPGEDLDKAEVVAPVVRQTLVRFQGQPSAGKFVEHLRFQGISFQHADCHLAPDMPLDQQGATERLPLIAAEGLRHAVFEGCELAHAGENGLWLDNGCCDNVVRKCRIHDLGASGVFIGPKDYKDTTEMRVERNVLDNNFIHDGSHIFRGSQGVWIGKSSYNEVTHNEISDFHHLGISIGHSWGYAPSTAHHNLVAFNHVHHICNGYFSDGGGIYTLGISPGTVIRGNIVHDIVPTPLMPDGGTGIYHDEGSTGILVENNLVYRAGIPYHQHYGRENVARNNIFAFALNSPVSCARPEEHLSYTFESNIVLSNNGKATSEHFSPLRCKTEFRRNLYWDTSGKEPSFSGIGFAQWQATGRDRDSRIADPQFRDAAGDDFRLKPASPALALGFQPIEAGQAGLYGDADWVRLPSNVGRKPLPELPPPPPPPPPRPYREDFESVETGKQPAGLSYSPADRPDLVQATEETASRGKKSLKFTKGEGMTYSWQPHAYRSSRPHREGTIRFACDVFNSADRPAECFLALRDYRPGHGEYREGPSLTFRADGALLAAGKELTRLPLGQWVHLEIRLDLGRGEAATSPTYRLAVTVPGRQEQVFDAVPCLHTQFGHLAWFGVSSMGGPGSVFFVDEIHVEEAGTDH